MAKTSAAKKKVIPPPPPAPPALPEPKIVAELRKVEGAIAEIGSVGAGIAALREKFAGVTFNVTTPVGMDEAKAARQEIRQPRYQVERIRKAAKAPILEMGRALDREAGRIESELLAIESPIDQAITAEEERIENERQAKVEAERQRIEGIQARIQRIRDAANALHGLTIDQLERRIAGLEALEVNADFGEFQQNAEDARIASLSLLKTQLERAKEFAAEQERVRLEREELARQRAEQARLDAEAKAKREAEQAELDRQRQEQEARDAELRRREEALKQKWPTSEPGTVPPTPTMVEADDLPAAAVQSEDPPVYAAGNEAEAAVASPGSEAIVDVIANHFKITRSVAVRWLKEAAANLS